MEVSKESLEDYLAKRNIEGNRDIWLNNHRKIDYIFNKSRRYFKKGMSTCEIGLGDGYLLNLVHKMGLKPTGIDVSNYLISYLKADFKKKGLDVNLMQYDISKLVEYEHTFDIIFCLDILEHLEGNGLTNAIKNIENLLNKNALFIASLPWKEELEKEMVICPKCQYEFHRIGHFHSFFSYENISDMLGKNFHIIAFEFVPMSSIFNKLKFSLEKTILKKIFRKLGLPAIKQTCFFIAQKK